MTRRIDVFLPKLLPASVLSPNHGERKEGRVPIMIGRAKRDMREATYLGLLAEDAVRAIGSPFDHAHVALTLRWHKRTHGRAVYLPDDPGNACYSLKAAIDGIVDAGLLADDSYRHIDLLTTRVERCDSLEGEGLFISVIEIEAA